MSTYKKILSAIGFSSKDELNIATLQKALDTSKLVKKKVQVKTKSGVKMAYRYVKPGDDQPEGSSKQEYDISNEKKKSTALRMLIKEGVLGSKDLKTLTGATSTQISRELKAGRAQASGETASAAPKSQPEPQRKEATPKQAAEPESAGERQEEPKAKPKTSKRSSPKIAPEPSQGNSKRVEQLLKRRASNFAQSKGVDHQSRALEDIATRFRDGQVKFGIIYGRGGLGKSYTTTGIMSGQFKKSYSADGFTNKSSTLGDKVEFDPDVNQPGGDDYDYVTISGALPANQIVAELYAHKDKMIILDDFDSPWQDPAVVNIFKKLCEVPKDAPNRVTVSDRVYDLTAPKNKNGKHPTLEENTFNFTGSILAITNLSAKAWSAPNLQPMISRANESGSVVDMTRTTAQQERYIERLYDNAGIKTTLRKREGGQELIREARLPEEQVGWVKDLLFGEGGGIFSNVPYDKRDLRTLMGGVFSQAYASLKSTTGKKSFDNLSSGEKTVVREDLEDRLVQFLDMQNTRVSDNDDALTKGVDRNFLSSILSRMRSKNRLAGNLRNPVDGLSVGFALEKAYTYEDPLDYIKSLKVRSDVFGSRVLSEV